MKFVIEGEPVSQKRHRYVVRKNIRMEYDPCKIEKEKFRKDLIYQLKKVYEDNKDEYVRQMYELNSSSFFKMSLNFYLEMPKSYTQTKKNRIIWGLDSDSGLKDIDNLAKFTLDCCKDVLFADDHFVVSLSCKKVYSLKPRTEIYIMPVKKQQHPEEQVLEIYNPLQVADLVESIDGLKSEILAHTSATEMDSREMHFINRTIAKHILNIAKKHAKLLTRVEKCS